MPKKKRKGSAALRWITSEAKHLRRKYPGKPWMSYIKQASAIYAEKHGGKSPVGHKHPKHRHRKVRGVTTASKSHIDKNRMTTNIQVGTIAGHMANARQMLVDKIGEAEARKFRATTKRAKRKIQRHISEMKKQYRKLC